MKKKSAKIYNGLALLEFIRANIEYNPVTGVLRMKGTDIRLPVEGDGSGGKRARVRIMGRELYACDVAYAARKGHWPDFPLAHLNGAQNDIRWRNLALMDPSESEQEEAERVAILAGNMFLADLRRHHPKGPPTYAITSRGIPVLIRPYAERSSSPAAMCAETI